MLREVLLSSIVIACFSATNCGRFYHQQPSSDLASCYHALKAIEGSITVGVSYSDFGALVRNLSTELLILEDRMQADASKQRAYRPVVNELRELLTMYRDSLEVWKDYIQG